MYDHIKCDHNKNFCFEMIIKDSHCRDVEIYYRKRGFKRKHIIVFLVYKFTFFWYLKGLNPNPSLMCTPQSHFKTT